MTSEASPIDSESPLRGTQAPTLPPIEGPPTGLPPALRIGSYTISGVLGEGSMGVVYRAVQDNPQRVVALKVLRAGGASPGALRRFEHETQILGRLQHPGIAQIFEAGVADTGYGSQPFFAMELIQGLPLNRYARAHELSLMEQLALLVKVCEGVQHAHQKGVIHRDLKPGNILVDETGQPKVLDFGIAIATDPEVRTRAKLGNRKQLAGTVPYMSLEQLKGDPQEVDTRTDVYALGVIAYELLAGRLPYDLKGKSTGEACRILEHQQPAGLGDVNKALRGDLEAIARKALQKDKTRRYQSASDLGEDIRRYLSDEPVLAHRPSAIYHFSKFARRNKTLVGAVVAVFISLVFGILGTGLGMIDARHQRDEAKAQRHRAEEEMEVRRAVNNFLNYVLEQAAPDRNLGRDLTVLEALDRAAENIEGEFGDNPLVHASIRTTLGDTYLSLGDLDAAESHFVAALEINKTVREKEHPATLAAMHALAKLFRHQGRYEEAQHLQVKTREISGRVLGDQHPAFLRATNELANLYRVQGKLVPAEALYRQSLDSRLRVLGEEDEDTLETMQNLAGLLKTIGNPSEAEELYAQVLAAQRRVLGDEHPSTLVSLNNLALLYKTQGRYGEAETVYRQTLEVRRRVLDPDHPATLSTMSSLATLLRAEGKLDEAEVFYRGILKTRRRVLGNEHPKTLKLNSNLAGLLHAQGKLDEAEKLYRETIGLLRDNLGDRHPTTMTSIEALGALLAKQGAYAEAERLQREALSLRREVLPAKHPHITNSLIRLGMVLLKRGDFVAAEPFLRECLTIRRDTLPEDDWRTANAENALGECLVSLGRLREAQPLLLHSYPIIEARWGGSDGHTHRALERTAKLYDALDRPDEAARYRELIAEGRDVEVVSLP